MSAITNPAALERIAAQTTAGAARKAARKPAPAAEIWDAFTLGTMVREGRISTRAARAQLARIEAERLRRLEHARAIVIGFDLSFADAPGGLETSPLVADAWNAAHDMVTSLEHARPDMEYADGADTTPTETRALIAANRD